MTPSLHVAETVGDLLKVQAEALVNAWNRNFVPRWLLWPHGVSGALKKRTGPGPWRDLAKMGLLAEGEAVVTGPGRMQGPRCIIHVAGLNMRWRATPEIVRRCATNVITTCDRLGMGSVAMPLVGAGTGGLSEDVSLAAIRDGLAAFPTVSTPDAADVKVLIVQRS